MDPEAGRTPAPDVSVVVPLYNEAPALETLHAEIREALSGAALTGELIFVDDGSTDESLHRLESISDKDESVRVISLRRNYGKSAALATGFARARGRMVATCDADLQDDPSEIPAMMERIDDGADLVSGWKRERKDPISKRWPSKLFNFVAGRLTGVSLHDMNCGLKVYRLEVVKDIPVYGELHRFLPALAAWKGYRVEEKVVCHRQRPYGATKFGRSRFVNGFLDLVSVMFLTGGQQNPLHLFGRVALWFLGIGGALNLWMFGIWVFTGALRSRPLLILGLVLMVLGIQFISIGLLGEMLAYQNRRDDYGIKREIR